MTEPAILTATLAGIAGIVWAVRIEGAVRSHEKDIAQLRADTKSAIGELREDVRYIRARIDEAIDHR